MTSPRSEHRSRQWEVLVSAGMGGLVIFSALVALSHRTLAGSRFDGGDFTSFVMYAYYLGAIVLVQATILSGLFLIGERAGAGSWTRRLLPAVLGLWFLYYVADTAIFWRIGLHLDSPRTWEAFAISNGKYDINLAPDVWVAGLLAILSCGGAGLLLTKLAPRIPSLPLMTKKSPWVIWTRQLGLSLLMMAALGVVDSQIDPGVVPDKAIAFRAAWTRLTRTTPKLSARYEASAYPDAPFKRRPDVVLMLAECLRWNMITPELTPNIWKFSRRADCRLLPRHYAGSHLTQNGTFSWLYGLESFHTLPFSESRLPSYPLRAFRDSGYRVVGLDVADVFSYYLPPLVLSDFDRYDTFSAPPEIWERDQLMFGELATILERTDATPHMVHSFFGSSHESYYYPPVNARFLPDDIRMDSTDASRQMYFNRYKNSVGFLDAQFARIAPSLGKRLDRNDLVFALSGDHGEEFWEFGKHGHAATSYEDVRTRVPLLLCGVPRLPREEILSEHADLMPTILDSLGADPAIWSAWLSGRSLADTPTDFPLVVLTGNGFGRTSGDMALVTPQFKFWIELKGRSVDSIQLLRVTDRDDRDVRLDDAALKVYSRAKDELIIRLNRFL